MTEVNGGKIVVGKDYKNPVSPVIREGSGRVLTGSGVYACVGSCPTRVQRTRGLGKQRVR